MKTGGPCREATIEIKNILFPSLCYTIHKDSMLNIVLIRKKSGEPGKGQYDGPVHADIGSGRGS